jgi:hypothetical protein
MRTAIAPTMVTKLMTNATSINPYKDGIDFRKLAQDDPAFGKLYAFENIATMLESR